MAKRTTINVRLLADIKAYGAKGSIVPVARGLFRNDWLPRRRAEYLSPRDGVLGSKATASRDVTFGRRIEEEEEEEEQQVIMAQSRREAPKPVEVKPIPPDQATRFLISTLPPILTFYRRPLGPSDAPPAPSTPSSPSSAENTPSEDPASSETTSTSATPSSAESKGRPIFGSVSTSDIAESVRQILLADEQAKVVTVGPENIWFMSPAHKGAQGIEGDRVKELGKFRIGLRVKGGEAIIRNVNVRPAVDSE